MTLRITRYVLLASCLSLLLAVAVWNPVASYPAPQASPKTIAWPQGKRVAVSLSFDDGRVSQVDTGLDIINPTGVKVTFFVNPPAMKKRLEGWKRAVASGHEIANHTMTHPCTGNFPWSRQNALEDYDLNRMSRQIDEANTQIYDMLGVHAVDFAYPCGQKFVGRGQELKSYVPLIGQKFLMGRGYLDEYYNDPVFCHLAQSAGTAFDDMDYIDMVKNIDNAAKQGGWIVFVGHDIGQKAFQVTDTTALAALCKYVEDPANGVWVDTVEHIAKYVIEQRKRLGVTAQ